MCNRVKVFMFGFVWKEQDGIYVFERGYSGSMGSMEVQTHGQYLVQAWFLYMEEVEVSAFWCYD